MINYIYIYSFLFVVVNSTFLVHESSNFGIGVTFAGDYPWIFIWLVLWNMAGLWLSIQLGMSWSQLTKSIIFQRGSYTTNQSCVFFQCLILYPSFSCSIHKHNYIFLG
jgi:hypothetical protein